MRHIFAASSDHVVNRKWMVNGCKRLRLLVCAASSLGEEVGEKPEYGT